MQEFLLALVLNQCNLQKQATYEAEGRHERLISSLEREKREEAAPKQKRRALLPRLVGALRLT